MTNRQDMLLGLVSLQDAPSDIRSMVLPKYLIPNPQVKTVLELQNTKQWISDRKALDAARADATAKAARIKELEEKVATLESVEKEKLADEGKGAEGKNEPKKQEAAMDNSDAASSSVPPEAPEDTRPMEEPTVAMRLVTDLRPVAVEIGAMRRSMAVLAEKSDENREALKESLAKARDDIRKFNEEFLAKEVELAVEGLANV